MMGSERRHPQIENKIDEAVRRIYLQYGPDLSVFFRAVAEELARRRKASVEQEAQAPEFQRVNGTPCVVCNRWHKGETVEHVGHLHEDRDGVGNVRLVILGHGPEFCWRCSCQKSGYRTIPNQCRASCLNARCICHEAKEAA